MKVFISWSGEDSRRVADLLRKYIPCIIQEIKPFMSQHDLSSGSRWSEQLCKELEQTNFGIICLTPNNLENPWILFEAGALTKHLERRACCLLSRGLRQTDVSGPLSQFQNRIFSRLEFQKLIFDMNALLENRLESTSLQNIIDKWWPDLEEEVTAALSDPNLVTSAEHKRDQSDLLEELLLRVRQIQRIFEVDRDPELAVGFSNRRVKDILEIFLRKLPGKQLLLLRELAGQDGSSRCISYKDLERKYSKEDIDALSKAGLVALKEDGIVIVHDLIAKYLSEHLLVKFVG
jgi:hypothetical protein